MSQTVVQNTENITDETYLALEKEVKNHLIKQLEMGKMDVQDVAKVCFLLGHAKTAEGLQFLIDNLKDDFDVMAEMKDEQDSEQDVAIDQIVQKYVADLIKTDPMKAGEVGQMASQEGMTLELLIERFPELKKYI